jgi:putative tryptophan/tyrosine transport system substrate-binding protein
MRLITPRALAGAAVNRRMFMSGSFSLALAPRYAFAQAKVPRIGYLLTVPLAEKPSPERVAFLQGLRDLGYIDGQSITVQYRAAAGNLELLPDLAAELVELKVDVIVVTGFQAVQATKQATKTVPIVMVAAVDPVATGLVTSLARPGGNVTGLTINHPETGGKRLELLKEVSPRASRIAVLSNRDNPATLAEWREIQAAARYLGVTLESFDVKHAQDLLNAFSEMTRRRPGALLIVLDTIIAPYRQLIAEFALNNRVPSILAMRDYAEWGGLLSYGPSLPELFRRAASYVDRLLKGARPSNLPIERPTKFELVANLKTAKTLGLTIPHSLLLRADEVIQ